MKYPGNIGRISPRDEFKRWVGKSRWASYYVDDEGIIREKEPRWRQPKKNFVKIATSEERFYYALNTTDHRIRYAIYVSDSCKDTVKARPSVCWLQGACLLLYQCPSASLYLIGFRVLGHSETVLSICIK